MTKDDVEAALPGELPGINFFGNLFLDSVEPKFYWRVARAGGAQAILRCNLDGSLIEVVSTEITSPETLAYPVVFHAAAPVPTVGRWGVGIMALLIIGAGGLVFRRWVQCE